MCIGAGGSLGLPNAPYNQRMAILNQDQDLVNNGRTKPLKDVEAPLRDQIPEKLAQKLDDLNIGEKVRKIWEAGNNNRAEWLNRQEKYLQNWDEFLVASADGAFEGASDLHIPMPLIVAKTLHARFLQALLGIDPPFTVKPRTEASVERAEMVQDLMGYTINEWANWRQGVAQAVDLWLWDWVTTGSGILKARWDVQYERFVDVVQVQKPGPTFYQYDQEGNEIETPTMKMVEEEQEQTYLCYEGPVFEFVNNEDLLIIGGAGDPQLADSTHHQQWLTASDLLTLVDRRVFREDEVMDVIEGGPDNVAGQTGSDIKQMRSQNAGKGQLDHDSDLDRYRIIESYLKIDVDGSGINSHVVTWTHPKSGKLLRATYLRRINKAGERPFFKIDFHQRSGQDYGVGIIEMLYPLSRELDAMHNMRIDYGMISNMPIGFYRPTSNLEPKEIQLRPGMMIPLNNPQADVYFPNWGSRTAFGAQEEGAIMTLIERLTTVSDFSLGVLSGNQGATRTATGVRGLLGESNSNLDVYLRRLNRGWKQAIEYLFHMLQQRLPKGLEFRVTGEAGTDYFRQVRGAEDIAGDFDFDISPNSANSNKQIQQETAALILQQTASPLDIQLGIVTPLERYEALKAYYKSLGIKDHGKYARKPEGIMRIFTPEEEANRVLRGVSVPVTPEMDHQGFIQYFEEIFKSDEILGQFTEDQAKALKAQAVQHERMMAALEQMQAQQNNAQQMRLNGQQSGAQSSPGQNPFAGATIAQQPVPGVK
jgi:hypothetical protein